MPLAFQRDPQIAYIEAMLGTLRRHIPRPVRNKLRRIAYLPLDATDSLLGRRDDLTPPRGLMFVGKGDFRETGEEYLHTFIQAGGLSPSDHVLDVGCGIGQMAVPLTQYLGENARYEGFDIVPEGIRWCQSRITPRYPRFQFQLLDTYNKEYNPRGKKNGAEIEFPYRDSSFDFVFLTSVFTHMMPADLSRYLREIVRVLRPGRTAFITYFLLTEDSPDSGERTFSFPVSTAVDDCWSIDPAIPERGIAYRETTIRGLYGNSGLRIQEPIHYGAWREHGLFRSQDVVVAHKG